jgi:hypothetical protein
MSQFPADRRETWITGIGIVSSLGDGLIGLGAARTQARSRNDICSMFEAALGAASGGHTWFLPLRFAA